MKAMIESGCIGCGLCAGTCPEVFEMSDAGVAEVAASPTAETIDCAKEAAESCPVSVIRVEE